MRFGIAQVIDAFEGYEIALSEDDALQDATFSGVELFIGQPVENDMLYVATSGAIDGADLANASGGIFVVASACSDDSRVALCVPDATAAQALNAINRYIARASACLDEMRTCYYDRKDLQGLCETLSQFVGNPVLAYDSSLLPMAQTEFPQDFALELFGSKTLGFDYVFKTIPDWSYEGDSNPLKYEGAMFSHTPDGSVVTAVCNVIADEEFQGFMEIFQVHKPITAGDMTMLEEAVKIVSNSYPLGENSFLLSRLKGRSGSDRLTTSWLSALKWRPDDGIYVIALDLPYSFIETKSSVEHVLRIVRALIPHSVNAEMGETPVIVANERLVPRESALASAVPTLARTGADICIGVSEVMTGIGDLHEGYAHAQFAARYARRLGGSFQTLRFEDCRFAFFADLCDLQNNRGLVLDANVARMFAEDVATGSENTRTAKVYLETGFNLNATARALSVHRNTVAYRLKHIANRYGVDLSSPVSDGELVFQVLLSCKLLLENV